MPALKALIVNNDDTPVVFGNTTITAAPTGGTVAITPSQTTVTLCAANANRKGLAIYYDGAAILSVFLGASSVPIIKMGQGRSTYWEPPFPGYSGQVRGQWSAAESVTANVSEVV